MVGIELKFKRNLKRFFGLRKFTFGPLGIEMLSRTRLLLFCRRERVRTDWQRHKTHSEKKNVRGQKYEKLIADAKNRNGHHTRGAAQRINGPLCLAEKMFLQVNALDTNV
jgi:hypothetical protein